MLGTPQGINRHIKHNITSCTGVQSLVLSRELLHCELLPQFKSQEVESNATQTGASPPKEYTWEAYELCVDCVSICIEFRNQVREFRVDITKVINIKSFFFFFFFNVP